MKPVIVLLMIVCLSPDMALTQSFEWADVVFLAGRKAENRDNEIYAAVDPSGNVYVTGKFRERVFLQDEMLVSKGEYDIFIAKYDPVGRILWTRSAGGAGEDIGRSIAVSPNGDVVLTGKITGQVEFGDRAIVSESNNDIFVAAYTGEEGTLRWVKRAGGAHNVQAEDSGAGVIVDAAGAIFVTGTFYGWDGKSSFEKPGAATFDTYNITGAVPATNSFVAKLNPDGEVAWVQCIGHYGLGRSNAVAVDSRGNAYIVGACSANFVVGKDVRKSNGISDLYIAQITPDGQHGWFRQYGSGDVFNPAQAAVYNDPWEVGTGICVDKEDRIFVVGQFHNEVKFGSKTLKSKGFNDVAVLRMNTTGEVEWAEQTGTAGVDLSYNICGDSNGHLYILGDSWSKPESFKEAGFSLSAGTGFVEQFDAAAGTRLWRSSAASRGLGVAANRNGAVYMVGAMENQAKFGDHKLDIKGKLKETKTSAKHSFWTGSSVTTTTKTYEAGFGLYMAKIKN